ncbi:CbtA family protein [Robbsia sp. Bb-Pol-6]|uniref:CbtA family protein n=1 Tax=Robbsia betulipollinis TaxID=2981849 RepID=A0ABT3ZSF5_9BURK|nr:CbtA family protein [Robbsia betulipollinis]MCY0389470.1 CbtA family protein [Robbsia betulipollinis]
MVGRLLLRGMLVGILAGLITFGVARVAGEPLVDRAIAFEQTEHAAAHEAEEPELVSRHTQASYGLLTGVVVYGAALGGLFALTFAYAYGRSGRLTAKPLAAWLAAGAFVVLVVVPALKYPANPPAVGDPGTIGQRTGLYFGMLAVSIAAAVFALGVRRRALVRLGAWNATVLAALVFGAVIAAVQIGLPTIDEVPADFPASVLWRFRLAALGMQAVLWTTIGLLFGWWVEAGQRQGHLRFGAH